VHDNAFFELSLVIGAAALVSIVMRVLRQPLILGYILTGILVGPAALNLIGAGETFGTFSSIGIALLLFIIGLGMNIAVIGKLGKTVFVAAAVELLIVTGIGTLACRLLGFSLTEAAIIGLSLFFSSTIIIVKFLSDRKEQNRLHGQIAIGIILLDDIVATLALLFVAAGNGHSIGIGELAKLALNGLLLAALLGVAGLYMLPRLARYLANSQEMLFLFAIAWGFGIASLFELCGFSIEIGALFAGVSLATLPYAREIESRLKPLRDFFVVLFFIVMGESLGVDNLEAAVVPGLILSAIVIILKPLAITTTLGLLGYAKRVSFMAGINLSQVSEFSIVLIALAATNKLVPPEATAIITIVAIVTIASSSYLIKFDDGLFKRFDRLKLTLFDRASKADKRPVSHYGCILFGYHHGGHEFIKTFRQSKRSFLVIDYDPDVVESLERQHIPVIYGDATDTALLDEIGVQNAKLIVSTIADFETNQLLVKHLNLTNPDSLIICNANNYEEALQLYELGSSYVMIPHYAGSEAIGNFIQANGISRRHFERYRSQHLEHLKANHPVNLAEQAL